MYDYRGVALPHDVRNSAPSWPRIPVNDGFGNGLPLLWVRPGTARGPPVRQTRVVTGERDPKVRNVAK